MKAYRVTAPMGITVPAGLSMKLNDSQLLRLRDRIETSRGWATLTRPAMFKHGEELALKDEPPKGLLAHGLEKADAKAFARSLKGRGLGDDLAAPVVRTEGSGGSGSSGGNAGSSDLAVPNAIAPAG